MPTRKRIDPTLKRAQIAAWRQASDPERICDCSTPLTLNWYKGEKLIAEDDLDQVDGAMHKRGDFYKSSATVDSYLIFCSECGMWLAVGQKSG